MASRDISDELSIRFDPGVFIFDMAPDLKLILATLAVTIAFIYVPVINDTVVRSALGLAMILFAPGYSLIAALFPGKGDIDRVERAALSFGASIAISPLIGLGLNYTPLGMRPDSLVICLASITLACALVANMRRHELNESERFSIDFAGASKYLRSELLTGGTGLDKALTVILVVLIVLAMGVAAYVITVPNPGEKFTEFYILNPDGKASNYPMAFTLGSSKPVVVGIVNHEQRSVTYDLVVALNDSANATRLYAEQLTLADNQTMEKKIDLKPDRAGTNMEIKFMLYADGNTTAPYKDLHVWANVTDTWRP